eukprot:TRINITY_DN1617_c0_g1_i2.p1 TRINITY_DN1617_c0_g1~~TRINITY_DN1617_c0_g1_i2.p1  ORF type:complete len:386 (-),score=63.23 TRINITY_DN1617_c0_g1_i2:29-1186(-)
MLKFTVFITLLLACLCYTGTAAPSGIPIWTELIEEFKQSNIKASLIDLAKAVELIEQHLVHRTPPAPGAPEYTGIKIPGVPYSIKEVVGWVWRTYVTKGPSTKNKGIVDQIAHSTKLNDILDEDKFELVFFGDFMDTRSHSLSFDSSIKDFVSTADWMVINMEATVTDDDKSYLFAQRHTKADVYTLSTLFPANRTLMSLANNHSGDFSKAIFEESNQFLKSIGYHLVGTAEEPFSDIIPNTRVVAATQWSNQPSDLIVHLSPKYVNHMSKVDSFNVLLPHWGYELEVYPRPEVVATVPDFLPYFETIIGSHSHSPQPVTESRFGNRRLVAYSLGDVTSGLTERFRRGKVIKSEEHTSELQSHSFISYAVFCLKKKKKTNHNTTL